MANRIYVTKANASDFAGKAMLAMFLPMAVSLQSFTTHAEENPPRRLARSFDDLPMTPAVWDKICAPKPEMTSKAKFSSAGLSGRLVDIDGEKPIEGALVVAIWSAQPRARVRPSTVRGFVHIAETQTDGEGRFTIPAWGPLGIMIPYEYGKEELMSTLVRADPELVIYSPVYGIITKDPEDQTAYPRRMRPGEIGIGKFDGIELRTRPYSNNEAAVAYARRAFAAIVSPAIRDLASIGVCVETRLPKTLSLILPWQLEQRALRTRDPGNEAIRELEVCNQRRMTYGCADLEQYVKEAK